MANRLTARVILVAALGLALLTAACGPTPQRAPWPDSGPAFGPGPYDGPEQYWGGTRM